MKILKVVVDYLPQSCDECPMYETPACTIKYFQECPLEAERTCGNCKHIDDNTPLVLCSADVGLCANSGGIESRDYCSRWEVNG